MAGAKFDILFAGELIGDADPDEVRGQLQQRFKLSDEASARLFCGRAVFLKRGVDTATASRYREVFRDAKALVQIRPVETPSKSPRTPAVEPAIAGQDARSAKSESESESEELRLATAAGQTKPLEEPSVVSSPRIDISYLHLVPGQDWSLEDCQPLPESAEVPDTSHLGLVTPAPNRGEERED